VKHKVGAAAPNEATHCWKPNYKRVAVHVAVGLALFAAVGYLTVTKHGSDPGSVPKAIRFCAPWAIPLAYLFAVWFIGGREK
jgi:hypothetical protein